LGWSAKVTHGAALSTIGENWKTYEENDFFSFSYVGFLL
jgi:hypothetical protein